MFSPARKPSSGIQPLLIEAKMDAGNFAEMATLAQNEIAEDEYTPQQDDGANGKKRKAEDGQPQQRAKRNRYISIACNEVWPMCQAINIKGKAADFEIVQATQDQMQWPDAMSAMR